MYMAEVLLKLAIQSFWLDLFHFDRRRCYRLACKEHGLAPASVMICRIMYIHDTSQIIIVFKMQQTIHVQTSTRISSYPRRPKILWFSPRSNGSCDHQPHQWLTLYWQLPCGF